MWCKIGLHDGLKRICLPCIWPFFYRDCWHLCHVLGLYSNPPEKTKNSPCWKRDANCWGACNGHPFGSCRRGCQVARRGLTTCLGQESLPAAHRQPTSSPMPDSAHLLTAADTQTTKILGKQTSFHQITPLLPRCRLGHYCDHFKKSGLFQLARLTSGPYFQFWRSLTIFPQKNEAPRNFVTKIMDSSYTFANWNFMLSFSTFRGRADSVGYNLVR